MSFTFPYCSVVSPVCNKIREKALNAIPQSSIRQCNDLVLSGWTQLVVVVQDATLWLREHHALDLTTEPWGVNKRETSMTQQTRRMKLLLLQQGLFGKVRVFELMSLTMFKKN